MRETPVGMLLMVTRDQGTFSQVETGMGADASTARKEERELEMNWEAEVRWCTVVSGPPVTTRLLREVHLAADNKA